MSDPEKSPIVISRRGLFKFSLIASTALISLFLIALGLTYKIDVAAHISNLFNDTEDECLFSSDFYLVRLSTYYDIGRNVSNLDYLENFCQDIPDTGPLIIVIDLLDEDVRGMPVKLKFVKLDDSQPTGRKNTLIYESISEVPKAGFIKSKIRFSNAGEYAVLVEVGDIQAQDYDVVTIPFKISAL